MKINENSVDWMGLEERGDEFIGNLARLLQAR